RKENKNSGRQQQVHSQSHSTYSTTPEVPVPFPLQRPPPLCFCLPPGSRSPPLLPVCHTPRPRRQPLSWQWRGRGVVPPPAAPRAPR
uniref:Uncharacterized protein n=1 Tax=Aegilops tauschii subsp. strangulata TaxID=200361 RepID=A0A453I8E4_AEGTS